MAGVGPEARQESSEALVGGSERGRSLEVRSRRLTLALFPEGKAEDSMQVRVIGNEA
jgi:hypothetical protein